MSRTRWRWLELHLGVDATTGEIAAHVLTDGHAHDAAQVPDLLRQPEGDIASLTADGAYDTRQPDPISGCGHPASRFCRPEYGRAGPTNPA